VKVTNAESASRSRVNCHPRRARSAKYELKNSLKLTPKLKRTVEGGAVTIVASLSLTSHNILRSVRAELTTVAQSAPAGHPSREPHSR
jgi:hypothetical protein